MNQIRVNGCPLCDIFLTKKVITKLYWPESIDEIPDSEFIIVDCKTCKVPMVVYGEHITTITREAWGRVLYRSRKLFGGGITLRTKARTIRDHWHSHIYGYNK